MTKVSKEQVEALESIVEKFGQNVVSIAGKGANKAFFKNTTFREKVRLSATRWLYTSLKGSKNYDKRAKRLVNYCETAVPALTRSFGEDVMVQAMKANTGCSEEFAAVSEDLGGKKIAALIRKSLAPAP